MPLRSQALLLYELLDQALAGQSQFRRLMCQTGRQFPEIQRLRTAPGVGLVGAHLFVAYVQDPTASPNSPGSSKLLPPRHPRPHQR